jgi:hypothetical protein
MTTLPPQICLYFSKRYSTADPHSGFVLMNTTGSDAAAWCLQPCEPQTDTAYTLTMSPSALMRETTVVNIRRIADGVVFQRNVYRYPNMHLAAGGGSPVPVYEITKHTDVLQSHLKRNITIQGAQTPAAPAPPPAATTQSKRVVPALSPHVAALLLELARSKREMCPIIMEEFMVGHTAALPCGHLFSRLAIEESFKKEINKCPACRQLGMPSYC